MFLAATVILSLLIGLLSYLFVDQALIARLLEANSFFVDYRRLVEYFQANRQLLAAIYLGLISGLFGLQIVSWLRPPVVTRRLVAVVAVTTLMLSLSYPFLSHDLFDYLFYGRMVWILHVNPFTVTPKDLVGNDVWGSLVHSIDSTSKYGPVALIYSTIPVILAPGDKFWLEIVNIKILNWIIFMGTGWLLWKMLGSHSKVLAIWFYNPLIIVELLVNGHNDLVMIGLFVVAIYALERGRRAQAVILFLSSVLTKFISIGALPMLFMNERQRLAFFQIASLGLAMFLVSRVSLTWYYSWVYMFLPFIKLRIWSWMIISLIGLILLANYYWFVRSGVWDGVLLIPYHQVIIGGLVMAVVGLEMKKRVSLDK